MPPVVDTDCLILGPLQTNCYVLRSGGECWVVDPGWPGDVVEFLGRAKVAPSRIVLTHGHGDHLAGVNEVMQAYPAAVLTCPAGDAAMLLDAELNLSAGIGFPITTPPAGQLVRPGDELALGETIWQVLDVSGHTGGGVSYYCAAAGVVLVGDALFAGSIGRCDFPGGDMEQLVGNIRRNLLVLPPATRVLSGHGPETTIGAESRSNPYL